MKFGAELVTQIISELEKIPNIRYVCNKVGIDHSTFYRWLINHPTFNKRVHAALFLGRRAISGAAETVIIKGVQKGEHRAATFWLTHNEPLYMQKEKAKHFNLLLEKEIQVIEKPIDYDGTNFESAFIVLVEIEKIYDSELATHLCKSIVQLFCNYDTNLEDVFFAAYTEWKLVRKQGESSVESQQANLTS